MRSWTPAQVYRPITRNVIVWQGPSRLTGAPILVVASAQNGNPKIGPMLQLWIIPATSPLEALRTGADAAVCGDCRLRGDGHGHERACYVWSPGVENIWQSAQKPHRTARSTPEAFAELVTGLRLRIGAYGDPVAVPLAVWMPMLQTATSWTAYTHQHRRPDAQSYRAFCMASVDSIEEQRQAEARGWRTFRLRAAVDDALGAGEIACPASAEAGHRTVCASCELCRGQARQAKSIAIVVHGRGGLKWFPSRQSAERELALTS